MANETQLISAFAHRWTAFAHRPRKDAPRVYASLTDAELGNLLRQTNDTLAMAQKCDHKRYDSDPEALSIRALPKEERHSLRQEALIAATRIRAEYRHRASHALKQSTLTTADTLS